MTAPRHPGWLRRFGGDTRAMAAAEMALVFPVVGFITVNVVDLGTYMYSKMQVDIAAQQAAGTVRSLCTNPSAANCGSTYLTQMQSAAQQTTLGTAVNLVGSPTESYYCANASGTLVLVATPPSTPPTTCAATVSGSTSRPGSYIGTTTTYTYAAVFPGFSVASYLSTPIQSTAWIRLQ